MLRFFRSKKFIFIAIIIAIVFFAGKYFFIDSKKAASNFTSVKRDDIKEELTLSGKIDTQEHAVLSFRIAGKVDWVGVKKGGWVKKGQIIATLEKETLEAALRQAWQDFTAAKAASDRYYDGRTGVSESYDQKVTRTALDATQNKAYDNIRIAQENLKSAVLYSPIEGLVVDSQPDLAGVNVTASNSNYEIVNPSTIYLKAIADQTEVGSLKNEQMGTIIFDSYPDEQTEGKVIDISFTPTKDETGTVYDIKVIFNNADNKDYKYRLGMTADINFTTVEKKNALIISSKHIKSDDKGKYVLLGKDRKKTYVKTGIENSENTEITDGLSEGDIVYD